MKKIQIIILFLCSLLLADTTNPPPFPDYGLIIPSQRPQSVVSQPINNILEIKKGWKLYGYDNGIYDVNLTFGSLVDSVQIVWAYGYDDQKWYAYTPDAVTMQKIQSMSQIGLLKKVDKFNGFWVLGLQDTNITLNPTNFLPTELVIINSQIPQQVTTVGGNFEISVSPLDDQQNLISNNLTKNNFYFQNTAIYDSNNVKKTDVNVSVTQLSITQSSTSSSAMNNVILDIDSSGSMSSSDPSRKRVIASKEIINLAGTSSKLAVLDFGAGSDNGLLDSRILQPFTNDINLLNSAVEKVVASGGTPLYESLLDAISLLKAQLSGTKSIIIFTDGQANSTSNFDKVVLEANNNGVTIYTIGLGSGVNAAELQELASTTGGLYAYADNVDSLSGAFKAIGTGTIKGRVIVKGYGVFNSTLTSGQYILKGKIGFSYGATSFLKDFELPVTIVN